MLAGTRNEGKDKARGGVQGVKHLPVALESNVSERRYAWAAIRMAAGDAATLACGPVRRSSAYISVRRVRSGPTKPRSKELPSEPSKSESGQRGRRWHGGLADGRHVKRDSVAVPRGGVASVAGENSVKSRHLRSNSLAG